MKEATVVSISSAESGERSRVSCWMELFKARLTALVLLTTLVGFYMGYQGPMNWVLMIHTLLATALVAAGAAALNQFLERDFDALMRRTQDRPLPSGRFRPDTVLLVGGALSAAGLIYLAVGVHLLASLLGAITLASYLFIYTPLKRVTPLNTIIGAVPGALPPLIGWVAAQGEVTVAGWSLFAILFFWQLPHFLAIGWMYREEYRKAGFVMLPVVDRTGERTGHQAVCHTLGLLPLTLCPFLFGLAGPVYLAGALALSALFLAMAIQFARRRDHSRARRLFLASIVYLPLLLGLMVLDKIRY